MKEETMSKPYVRECYEGGNPVTGRKIYEIHKMCDCNWCKNKFAGRKRCNSVTATTKSESTVPKIIEYLKTWKCKDETKDLPVEYLAF